MRIGNYSLVVIILFLLFSCGNHSNKSREVKQQVPSTENLSSPGIVFLRELHNFGTLKSGEIVSFSFVFINSSKVPITIKKVETSCGCIKVNYDKNEIGRGEKSSVEVIFNTSGEWGNQLKMVHVETSLGEIKELRIGAYVENEKFNNLINTQK